MVAQVEPGEGHPPERRPARRGRSRTPCRRSQGASRRNSRREPTAVGQYAARHAASRRPGQRLGHAPAHAVVLEDVEQQVDVLPRGIDVGDQAVDDHVRVVHQRDRVAGHHRQPADVLGRVGQHAIARRPHEFRRCGPDRRADSRRLPVADGDCGAGPSAAAPAGSRRSADRAPGRPRAQKKRSSAKPGRWPAFPCASTITGSIVKRITHSLAASSTVQNGTSIWFKEPSAAPGWGARVFGFPEAPRPPSSRSPRGD